MKNGDKFCQLTIVCTNALSINFEVELGSEFEIK